MTAEKLIELLKTVPAMTKIYMQSDSEGNQINNLFRVEKDKSGLFLVPDDADLQI